MISTTNSAAELLLLESLPEYLNEKLFQFIWQFGYFTKTDLITAKGERVEIIFPGKLNSNQGPDFTEARIKIGDTLLAGSVELHLKTSDWELHKHSSDKNYNNVILHAVYKHDTITNDVPVLELQPQISNLLLEKYNTLMLSTGFIPCEKSINNVKALTLQSWKERLVAERLTRKSNKVFEILEATNYHWEECFWRLLARNFGIKVNADAFEELAASLPINLLAKHKNQIHQMEALLLGQANLLNKDFKEDYPKLLKREYEFLKKKYNLKSIHSPVHFLRMRPGNFPTIRLAQLAMLIHNSLHLLSKIIEEDHISEIKGLFDVTANDYWHYHYLLDEPSLFKHKKLGSSTIDNIIINTVAPGLFAYGLFHKEEKYKDKAVAWLEEVKPETNAIIQSFNKTGIKSASAFDSQALLELKSIYCNQKRCLQCAVGNSILK